MNIKELLSELLQFSKEREWFEFKENWFEPIALGEYVSALSNAAALVGKEFAYFVWGVFDKEHALVGTDFDQYQDYKNEPYINFLNRNLNPRVKIDFFEDNINGKRIVVLRIESAKDIPTAFNRVRYIRIGSLKDTMEKIQELRKNYLEF